MLRKHLLQIICWILFFGSTLFLQAQSAGGILAGYRISADPAYTIIYQNVADTTMLPESFHDISYRFDLDKDGIQDFSAQIFCGHVMGTGETNCVLVPLTPSGRIAVYPDSCHKMLPVLRMETGDVIDAGDTWQNKKVPMYIWSWFYPYSNWTCGTWKNQPSKIAGLSLINGNDTLYGWIRMSVIEHWPCVWLTVHDYAVKKRNPLGLTPVSASAVKLHPNPSDGPFILFTEKTAESVQIISNTGQLIRAYRNVQGELPVDMSGSAPGIYFIVVHYPEGQTACKKVLNIVNK